MIKCNKCFGEIEDNIVVCPKCGEKIKLDKIINTGITSVLFGTYPQSKVYDDKLIKILKKESKRLKSNNVKYEGKYYYKYIEGFYLIEPIKWKILEIKNGTCKMITESIIDKKAFYDDGIMDDRLIKGKRVFPNNYEFSTIRAWLNGYDATSYTGVNYKNHGFIDIAFSKSERELIKTVLVDNSSSTAKANSRYCASNDTRDKIYLLCFRELLTEKDIQSFAYNEFGSYTYDNNRAAKYTDYADAKKAHSGGDGYWLRSPAPRGALDYGDWNVSIISHGGRHDTAYSANRNIGVCPVVEIELI